MKASIAIRSWPHMPDKAETVRVVDEVIAYIASTGLSYYVGPFETTVEGEDYDHADGDRGQLRQGGRQAGSAQCERLCEDQLQAIREILTIHEKVGQASQISCRPWAPSRCCLPLALCLMRWAGSRASCCPRPVGGTLGPGRGFSPAAAARQGDAAGGVLRPVDRHRRGLSGRHADGQFPGALPGALSAAGGEPQTIPTTPSRRCSSSGWALRWLPR